MVLQLFCITLWKLWKTTRKKLVFSEKRFNSIEVAIDALFLFRNTNSSMLLVGVYYIWDHTGVIIFSAYKEDYANTPAFTEAL